jgi:alanine dehydrogenase
VPTGTDLYTYLHLASNEALTHGLLKQQIIGVAYETIQLEDGSFLY